MTDEEKIKTIREASKNKKRKLKEILAEILTEEELNMLLEEFNNKNKKK